MAEPTLKDAFQKIMENQLPDNSPTKLQEIETRWWQTIVSAYSEPQRYYHTVDHINSMWDSLNSMPEEEVSDTDAVVLAILFHDIVYDPTAPSEENERKSMQLWQQFAEELGLDVSLTNAVLNLIEATIKHALTAEYPKDLPLFLDLDLEVLGRPRELYVVYAAQIRQEYGHYPEDAYCRGRTAVLQHLKKGDVYFTEHWKNRLAAHAQANLDWEVSELTNGAIPNVSKLDNMNTVN